MTLYSELLNKSKSILLIVVVLLAIPLFTSVIVGPLYNDISATTKDDDKDEDEIEIENDSDSDSEVRASLPLLPLSSPNETQIIITDNIIRNQSIGTYIDIEYNKRYNVLNVFDNAINTYSFWSQRGESSFAVELKNAITTPLCSIQVNAKDPLDQPYRLQLLDSELKSLLDYNGTLDNDIENIALSNCVEDVKQIGMSFKAPANEFTVISEMKLFSNSIVPPPPPPEPCPPNMHRDPVTGECVTDIPPPPPPPVPPIIKLENGTINIYNSTVPIVIDDATITINANTVSTNETDTDEDDIDSFIPDMRMQIGGVN